jgi:hypothetical protein
VKTKTKAKTAFSVAPGGNQVAKGAAVAVPTATKKPEWDSIKIRVTKTQKEWLHWSLKTLGSNVNAWGANEVIEQLPRLIKRARARVARLVGK